MNKNLVCPKYEYVLDNRIDHRNLQLYTYRMFQEGILEAEEVLLKLYFNSEKNILDFGTGCGRLAINAYNLGYTKMYGLDVNFKFIEKAQKINKIKNSKVDFYYLPSMDLQSFKNYFEHVIFTSNGLSQVLCNDDKLSVLKYIYKMMVPYGIGIISVVDKNLVEKNAFNYIEGKEVYVKDGAYMPFVPIENITKLIKSVGFDILGIVDENDILGYKDTKSMNVSKFYIIRK